MKSSNQLYFKVSECTEEFLQALTQIHAQSIYFYNKLDQHDHFEDWQNAKKITTLNIIESYLQNCQDHGKCPSIPECCSEYIEKVDKDEIKKILAYFLWEKSGSPFGKDKDFYIQASVIIDSFFEKYEEWKNIHDQDG